MDIYSLRLNFSAPVVGVIQNVMHWITDPAQSDGQRAAAESLMGGFMQSIWPKWAPCLAPEVVLHSTSARRVNDTGGATYTVIQEVPGTGTSPMADSGIAMDIALTPKDFPWQPGHIYLGPVPQGFILENAWQGPFLQTAQELCNALRLQLQGVPGAATYAQVIYSRKLKTSRDIAEWLIRPKPTALNKRLEPYP